VTPRAWAALVALLVVTPPRERPVVVASKPFGESYILAEIFAQLLEARGLRVERRLGLGATEIAYAALERGEIDVYPEYTGTALLTVLHQQPLTDPRAVFARVSTLSRQRDGIEWLPPLGFQNSYAIAVRRATADSLHLVTLDDLARAGPSLRAGFTADFIGRADGLPGLARAYGLKLRAVHALTPALKYQALAQRAVDVIDGYTTDGLIARYDLVVLADDRHFFPPYEAAAVLSASLQRDVPRAAAVLTELSDRIDEGRMRALNRRVEVDGVAAAVVARDALTDLGLVATTAVVEQNAGRAGTWAYLREERGHLLVLTEQHILLVAASLGVAILIAVPAGLAMARTPRRAETVLRVVGGVQTLPGIALLAFMIPLLGIGVRPALVALTLYSLYPILRNTYIGVRDAVPSAVDAAEALGMTPRQVLLYVRLPLAAPVIMAGVRTAAVLDVGTATLAAFIGAGGLGEPIVSGLALSDTRMILSGAIPAALLALAVDGLLALAEHFVTDR
jgi:osmoprotectant transport system permease protein